MSALAQVASRKDKYVDNGIRSGVLTTYLPDLTPFEVTVICHDSHGADGAESKIYVRHPLDQSVDEHGWVNQKSLMQVTSAALPFAGPTDEPDDNTLAARIKRFAKVSITGKPITSTHRRWVSFWGEDNKDKFAQLWTWISVFFATWEEQEHFLLLAESEPDDPITPDSMEYLITSKLAIVTPDMFSQKRPAISNLLVSRAAFWQGFGSPTPYFAPWILPKASLKTRALLQASNTHRRLLPQTPPYKPSKSDGPLYSRYFPEWSDWLHFEIVSSSDSADVENLTRWHNSDRVNDGWRQRLPADEQLKTIKATEDNPYTIGLIGKWGDEAWGYVEIYYAKQSNLKDFYQAGHFDRGFHALVGNEKFRGPRRVRSWMASVVHLMFLLDPSTDICVSEPRLSNSKMVAYEESIGGNVEKFIDFNHKRAALITFSRERFFQLCPFILPYEDRLDMRSNTELRPYSPEQNYTDRPSK